MKRPERNGALLMVLFAMGCGAQSVTTAKFFSGEPVPHWLEQAKHPDAKLRLKALEVLGNVGPADPEAIPTLIRALKDKNAKCRSVAVVGLSKIGSPAKAALPALQEISGTENDPAIKKLIQTAMARVQGQDE